MTLDEAIESEKRDYEFNCKNAEKEKNDYNNYVAYGIYGRWADKHKQYADWLEELKMYKSLSPRELVSAKQKNDRVIEYSKGFYFGYKAAYSKAIDDFAEKIAIYGTYDDYGNVVDVLEIAEKLKKECAE